MYTRESTEDREARAARYASALQALEAAGPRTRPAVDAEAHIKTFISDVLGTSPSQTELLYTLGELLSLARDLTEFAPTGTVDIQEWSSLLSDSTLDEKRYGPPFRIPWTDFLGQPLIAATLFALQESFLRLSELLERASGAPAEKRFQDRVLELLMERTNLMPRQLELARFDREPPTARTFREPAAPRADHGRDAGIYRDGALDRMSADARDVSRAGDFPRNENTGRTA